MDSVSLALAKGEDVLVGRVIPGCWAAAPSDIQDRRGGDRKETSTLGSQLSFPHLHILFLPGHSPGGKKEQVSIQGLVFR